MIPIAPHFVPYGLPNVILLKALYLGKDQLSWGFMFGVNILTYMRGFSKLKNFSVIVQSKTPNLLTYVRNMV